MCVAPSGNEAVGERIPKGSLTIRNIEQKS